MEVEENTNNISKNKKIKIIIIVVLVLILGIGSYFLLFFKGFKQEVTNGEVKKVNSPYRITGSKLQNFDLYFMQLENETKNKVYSPLSIKYALEMLSEGAKGETKKQLDNIIGEYKANKYTNSSHMSFANAMFIRNSFKDKVKKTYANKLKNKYNAEVVYDDFTAPDKINNWVSEKTFKLIPNLLNDISDNDFLLINALAIDMDWKNVIQEQGNDGESYYISYLHEKVKDEDSTYHEEVCNLDGCGYHKLEFNEKKINAKSVEIGASFNKYDIIEKLGEANIRKIVSDELNKWLASEDGKQICNDNGDYLIECQDTNKFMDKYIEELKSNYQKGDISTDFSIYNDDKVKVFAKDLKEYDGVNLQYVGIMPKTDRLEDYIKNSNAKSINKVINGLKEVKIENFEEGKITKIYGYIPLFKFDYELKLKEDLNKLGIKNVFDKKKSDLSNIVEGSYVDKAIHKANIDFNNVGIKASAATVVGGYGATSGPSFDYLFDIPIEEIDMTFDKPYMYIVRDKNSGEVWFSGTVYEPAQYQEVGYDGTQY